MIRFAQAVKSKFNFDVDFEGEIEEILENPRAWAEKQAESAILENANKYKEAFKLGEEFANEVNS